MGIFQTSNFVRHNIKEDNHLPGKKVFLKNQNRQKIHFIGIGGIGMSGIAEVLLKLDFEVTGSDVGRSDNVDKLEKYGAKIFLGHESKNITNQSVVVYSSAIKNENPEMQEALNKSIPIMKRAEMLGELMRLQKGLAVAGTHGKTTTTSLLATIFEESKKDPTYIIGGIPKNLKGHAKVGKGDILVAEADESDGSFLYLNPIMSVITNIDNDHLDYYGSEENLFKSYVDFANKVPFYGLCSLCAHDEKLMSLKKIIKRPSVTYGISGMVDDANFLAANVVYSAHGSSFDLIVEGLNLGNIQTNIPGVHNILNTLGAISLAYKMGITFTEIKLALEKFEGVGRRFQILYNEGNVEIIDDYGHHPTEVQKTIETAKKTRPDRKIVAIFEPHRFTRTRDCWESFLHCFNSADQIYLCPIYAASETPIDGITSEKLVKDINRLHVDFAHLLSSSDQLKNVINLKSSEKVTYMVMGAGAIGKKIREFLK